MSSQQKGGDPPVLNTRLLVRSLSDGANCREAKNWSTNQPQIKRDNGLVAFKALTMHALSLSDSKICSQEEEEEMSFDTMDSFAVDDEEDEPVEIPVTHHQQGDEFLDEGCFLVSLSSSPVSPQAKSPEKEKKSEEEAANGKILQRRSPSDVDSGRVSDTDMGTTSSNNSKNSNSSTLIRNEVDGQAANLSEQSSSSSLVQIVPHTYCDFLGTMQRNVPPSSNKIQRVSSRKSSAPQAEKESDNRVTVFVPYSTIVRCMNETLDRKRRQKKQRHKTQVCKLEEPPPPQCAEKIYSKRMTKRLQQYNDPVAIKQEDSGVKPCMLMLADEDLILPCPAAYPPKRVQDFHEDEVEEPISKTNDNPQVIPRRKDLCKLLGLNEKNVGEVLILDDDEVKVAQKVALMHTANPGETEAAAEQQQPAVQRKRSKDLAKFLGVDDASEDPKKLHRNSALLDLQLNGLIDFDEDYPAAIEAQNVIMRKKKKGSLNSASSRSSRPRSLLVNWSNMMKRSSVRWKSRVSTQTTSIHDRLEYQQDDDSTDDDVLRELQVPVQFRQMSDNQDPESGGVKRKDLSKFLGLDDSDSEEIVFIQNNKTKPTDPTVKSHSDTYSCSFESSSLSNKPGSCGDKASHHEDSCHDSDLFQPLEDNDDDTFCHPPRKSVNFKEYGFSVEQSIAQGLPIIPGADSKVRKKKKEAVKRSAEIYKNPSNETSLQTLLRIANDEWPAEEEQPQEDRPRPVRSALRSPNSPPKCGPVVFGANSRRTISPIRKSHYNFQRKMMKNVQQPQNVLIHPAALNGCLPAVFYQGQRFPVLFYGQPNIGYLPQSLPAAPASTTRGRSPHPSAFSRPISPRKNPRQRQQNSSSCNIPPPIA